MRYKNYRNKEQIAVCIPNAINESSLSRVYNQVKKFDSGTISAFRDRQHCNTGDRYTKKENMERHHILESKLLKLGYGVTEINGTYVENYNTNDAITVKEKALLVIDIKDSGNLWDDLVKLGTEFEQDSITYSKPSGKYILVGTNKCPKGYPGWKKVVKLGKSMFGKKGEFYSKVNGRPFVFESCNNDIDTIKRYPPTQIRGISYRNECYIVNGEIHHQKGL